MLVPFRFVSSTFRNCLGRSTGVKNPLSVFSITSSVTIFYGEMKKGLNFVVWHTGYLIFLIMYSERQGFPYGWFITEVKREIRIRCISEYTQLRYDCISYAGTCLIRHEVCPYCEKMDQKFDGYENEVERKKNFIQTRTNCRERSTRCVANIESFDRSFSRIEFSYDLEYIYHRGMSSEEED